MHLYSFEKLEVWKLAGDFCVYIYKVTNAFPTDEKFARLKMQPVTKGLSNLKHLTLKP